MSLRVIHLIFLIIVVAGADLFGAWGIREYLRSHEGTTLAMGLVGFFAGSAVLVYSIWFARKAQRAHLP